MSYEQYTVCQLPEHHNPKHVVLKVIAQGLLAGAVGAALVAGWCSFFALPIAGFVSSIAYCQWWLYHRLVCLGGDVSAVGMLVSVEPPSEKHDAFGELDSDYSINLLLYPNAPGADRTTVETSAPYGQLVAEQAATKDRGWTFTGYEPGQKPTKEPGTERVNWVFHAEFEGGGVSDFMTGSQIALGLATAALIACAAIPPPWGYVVGAILAFLAFLAWLIGYIVGESDYAAPGDVSGSPSVLHTNNPVGGVGADLLYIQGTWVYDSAHTGWNEIHPIKVCTKVGEWTGEWPADIPEIVAGLDAGFAEAASPLTVDRGKDDHNSWTIHPDIDGCGDDDHPPPDPLH